MAARPRRRAAGEKVKKRPPVKKAGVPTGRRRFDGEVLDVTGVTGLLGGTDKMVRSRVSRGLIPHRRWGGRVIFLRSEVLAFLARLEGVTPDEALVNIARSGRA
jgi:hypothetical protein